MKVWVLVLAIFKLLVANSLWYKDDCIVQLEDDTLKIYHNYKMKSILMYNISAFYDFQSLDKKELVVYSKNQ